MHEWALAEAVIKALEEILREERASEIIEVTLGMGELQPIDIEVFLSAFRTLAKNTPIEKAKVKIHMVEAEFKCELCGFRWKLKDVKEKLSEDVLEAIHFVPEIIKAYMHCPKCGSTNYSLCSGRGVAIEAVKVKK